MDNLHKFFGVDPAPAFGKKADDGALVAGRAFPTVPGVMTTSESDWTFQFIWAYRLRGASMREWSGFVHRKHQDFNFTRIMLDPQAGGGGGYLHRELRSSRQLIDQIETETKPIVTLDDVGIYNGAHILHLFKRKDPAIAMLWPILAGDDNLVDAMHTVFRQVLERTGVMFPPGFDEIPREVTSQWSEERQWAARTLAAVRTQLAQMQVATNEDGSYALTARGAKQFSSIGRKDLAYAAIYCYIAFRCWLVTSDFESDADRGGESFTMSAG